MKPLFIPMIVAAVATVTALPASSPARKTTMSAKNIYEFTMDNIDGKPVKLAKFKGKVLLVVNVASQCGNTPQYAGLEEMFKKYKPKGFEVLGFPANEFGSQEPGSNAEIKQFCTGTYDVSFPMFSKVVVKGDGIVPLYQWLIDSTDKHDIDWNFAKFLIGRDGKVIQRFSNRTKPDDPKLVAAVEAALAQSK